MEIKLIQRNEYVIKYKKVFDEIMHEYSETFDYEPEFKFRLNYLKSEDNISNIHAYHVVVNEFDIDTL